MSLAGEEVRTKKVRSATEQLFTQFIYRRLSSSYSFILIHCVSDLTSAAPSTTPKKRVFILRSPLDRRSSMQKMGVAVEEVENQIAFVPRPLVTVGEIHLVLPVLINLAGMDAVRFPEGDYLGHAGIQKRDAK